MSGDYTRQSSPEQNLTTSPLNAQSGEATQSHPHTGLEQRAHALIEQLNEGSLKAAITFAGQGVDPLTELIAMSQQSAKVAAWVELVDETLRQEVKAKLPRQSGFYPDGFMLKRWLQDPSQAPDSHILRGAATSVPLILTVQVARIIWLMEQGLDVALAKGHILATTGHSQGMMAACLLAESVDPKTKVAAVDLKRAAEYVRFGLWEALHMDLCFMQDGFMGQGDPMVAIAGPERSRLEKIIAALNARVPEHLQLDISLANTHNRHVVSGVAQSLAQLKQQLERLAAREQESRKQGKLGGAPLQFTWEPLQVSGAFHSRHMTRAREAMRQSAQELGFTLTRERFGLKIINAADGSVFNDAQDLLDALLHNQFTDAVDWPASMRAVAALEPELVLDLGPGDGVMRLVRSNLQGSGAHVIALATDEGQRELFTRGLKQAKPSRFSDYSPALGKLPSGRLVVDNRYTRATGHSPMILPGMTPTTVDVGIVAAAANAGYTAELAGGGQVNAQTFWARMEELEQQLQPGAQIIFNALYLDRYLWDLHLGRERLVQRARQAGAPIIGVTISAGIPPVEEAVALLDDLAALGITQNAFKPGTVAQVELVCKIARAASHHTIFVHLEGGKAGGHHSWEDLDELLLSSYGLLRREPNLVLCVGGGVATPERAAELLSGRWAIKHGRAKMPLDAILLGTVTMACLEATTSPQVKRALVEAKGSERWVFDGTQDGQITSGKSQLGADIHYIDNAASRAGRLLDKVAGDIEAITAHKAEIIEALNATAKPYFGELEGMSWATMLERLFALLAVGRQGRYEDGPWLDRTHRQRAFDALQRAQQRAATQPTPNVLSGLEALDQPQAALKAVLTRYPELAHITLLPQDIDWFIHELCARPGKPVNFVPTIDADVRRWYKSDSLWQAHDDRFEADQVLIIPGPQAVAGIAHVDEPVASLLARFEQALIDELRASGAKAAALPYRDAPREAALPQGYAISHDGGQLTLEAMHRDAELQWLSYLSGRYDGPIAQLLSRAQVFAGTKAEPNPARQLLNAHPGAKLIAKHQGRDLVSLTWERAQAPTEKIVFSLDGADTVIMTIWPATLPEQDSSAPMTLRLERSPLGDASFGFSVDASARARSMARCFGASQTQRLSSLHDEASATIQVDAQVMRAYAAQTQLSSSLEQAPHDAAFVLLWPALLECLTQDELVDGLLKLVHLDNATTPLEGWPMSYGEQLQAKACVVRVEDNAHGRTISTRGVLWRGTQPVAQVRSRFFVRAPHDQTPYKLRERDLLKASISQLDEASIALLQGVEGFSFNQPLKPGQDIALIAHIESHIPRHEAGRWSAHGELIVDGEAVGQIELAQRSAKAKTHPLLALLETLDAQLDEQPRYHETPRSVMLAQRARAPRNMDVYAELSGDHNPIHRSPSLAKLAGLEAPIVHGMWTSARLTAATIKAAGPNGQRRLGHTRVEFLAPLELDEQLAITVRRIGLAHGALILEAVAEVMREGERVTVAKSVATLNPPKTAYILPGQGIQQTGMGMDGYKRSRAAREVWDKADLYAREHLGFSILHIVRDNPKSLIIGDQVQRHQAGVLNLTQFTQVAMAVLARAQVAELTEAGAFVPDAITCGHSVGEYNALSAVLEIIPIEDVVEIVYQRGMAMHKLVPRDAQGRSGFAMGVAMPHHAGLSHAQVEALVEQLRDESGQFIEIVNYNVRGRQYSVTGHEHALKLLEDALMARRIPGRKAPWVLVPGIDVPFHSTILRDGVESFRQTLIARLPKLKLELLQARYIPNLLPKAFSLNKQWAIDLQALTGSQALMQLVQSWEQRLAEDRDELARALLVELLAWQFASPVRWIETQELMFKPVEQGGLGVERIIEIGVGYQPTAANMARASLSELPLAQIEVLNMEAERDRVFEQEVSELEQAPLSMPSSEPVAQESAPAPAAAAAPTPQAAATQAPAPRPTPSAGASTTLPAPNHEEGLRALLAIQVKLRPEQIDATESIDELVDGVSSKRNQILMDLGAEFDTGAIDGAHELALGRLIETLQGRAARYSAPGRFLSGALDELMHKLFRRSGLSRAQLVERLTGHWSLSQEAAHGVLVEALLALRGGESNRGGKLGALGELNPGSKDEALAVVDKLVLARAERLGVAISAPGQSGGAGGGQAVDAAVVKALEEKILGPQGVLLNQARALIDALDPSPGQALRADALSPEAATLQQELGDEFARMVAPRFKPLQHVAFTSSWAFAQRDVARVAMDALNGRISQAQAEQELMRIAPHARDMRVAKTMAWYAAQAKAAGFEALSAALERAAQGGPATLPFVAMRPELTIEPSGDLVASDVPTGANAQDAICALFEQPEAVRVEIGGATTLAMRGWLLEQLEQAPNFKQTTALVTGASPGSIALELVAWLLRGGARVIVTTSSMSASRTKQYQRFYQQHAVPGAELHVVPFNQASAQDVEALADWLFDEQTEQAGATVKVVKQAWRPDLLIPFGAMKDLGSLDTMSPKSEAALRALLLGVERLTTALAVRHIKRGAVGRPLHVLLPLSPNLGTFGGDGTYGEGKAALEALLAKWRSEHEAWARVTTMCGARIGWVRGTGLMDANDAIASGLERRCGVRTFSAAEMGALLASLCSPQARELAADAPLRAELTGGMERVDDLRAKVDQLRQEIASNARHARTLSQLQQALSARLGEPAGAPQAPPITPLPSVLATMPAARISAPWPAQEMTASLEDTVVIVGLGELGPLGNARTRFDFEVQDELSAATVLELAWMTGLLRYERGAKGGQWIDTTTNTPVPEHEIGPRFEAIVRERVGIRFVGDDELGFNPAKVQVLTTAYLDRDYTFSVQDHQDALDFLEADPENTSVRVDERSGQYMVTRKAGAEIKLVRNRKLTRSVAGALPTGYSAARFGIGADMVQDIDPVCLYNLIATVEAFLSAGLTPEELLAKLHPVRVGNTQGAGMGGMRSLRRMYTDHLLDQDRQSDIIQESLINVIAAYVVQSYVGSYGPMVHPVGACATAAVSLEEGLDKILTDRADFIVAGAFDDLGREGMVSFGDMNATANTEDMLERGFEPRQMSRSNDRRRRGFVEAQGGGTMLLARASVALELGLPVYGVLAWAGSYADGVHTSIPAPGQGLLAAAIGQERSPMAKALRRFGLSADDIALVYKHDTSTEANDPNENALHHAMQTALGRTPGNPLWVVSQKTLTGHCKGGAAAWQAAGLCQSMLTGVIPGNRNLESVDDAMRRFGHMAFTDATLSPGEALPMRAGMLTSLGFGHVSAIALILHPDAFMALLPQAQRADYQASADARVEQQRFQWAQVLTGQTPLVQKRTDRRLAADHDPRAQEAAEHAMLLNPEARFDLALGAYIIPDVEGGEA